MLALGNSCKYNPHKPWLIDQQSIATKCTIFRRWSIQVILTGAFDELWNECPFFILTYLYFYLFVSLLNIFKLNVNLESSIRGWRVLNLLHYYYFHTFKIIEKWIQINSVKDSSIVEADKRNHECIDFQAYKSKFKKVQPEQSQVGYSYRMGLPYPLFWWL